MEKYRRLKRKERRGSNFFANNAFWIVVNTILLLLITITYKEWLNSSEKALLDESNNYQIEMHHKNTEELQIKDTNE